MVMYRRNFVAGGTYFFTLALADRRSTMLIDRIDELREAYRSVVTARDIDTLAICILPDHLHSIWTMPDGDANYSSAWALIKARFSRSISKTDLRVVRTLDAGFNVWQRRFWEHTIRGDRDLENHVNYIHFNPVKHGHVLRAVDWPHSSFHRYVHDGLLPADWASDSKQDLLNYE
jgi:putative transposase